METREINDLHESPHPPALTEEHPSIRVCENGVWGLLTQRGAQQLRDVGGSLREGLGQYGLTPRTVRDPAAEQMGEGRALVRTVSTPVHRTVLSAQNLLQGLFKNAAAENPLNMGLDRSMDPFTPAKLPARAQSGIEPWITDVLSDERTLEIEREQLPLRQNATAMLVDAGLLSADVAASEFALGWPWLTEICVCLQQHGALPPGIGDEQVDHLERNLGRRWRRLFLDPHFYECNVKPTYQQVVENALKWSGTSSRSDGRADVLVYSAHDTTLFALLCALEREQPHVEDFAKLTRGQENHVTDGQGHSVLPPYASTLVFTLWDTPQTEQVELQVTYNGRSLGEIVTRNKA